MQTHTLTHSTPLQLHMVPAGRRLDFETAPGCFAYVYRRCRNQAWQCVAQNACSPFLDNSKLPNDANPEYIIRYRDSNGAVQSASPVVRVHPVGMPASPSWISL